MNRIILAATAATLVAAALPAQGMRLDRQELWTHLSKTYDKDKDGTLTFAEYGRAEAAFKRWDANGDGVLTEADFSGDRGGNRGRNRGGNRGSSPARMARMIAPNLAKLADKNDSRTIEPAEWKAFIASLGAGEDGIIPADKVSELVPARGGRGGRRGQGRGGQERGGQNRDMAARMARMLDTNGNEVLDTEDLQTYFAALDGNKDGTLQQSELGVLPQAGDVAPDFDLPYAADKEKSMRLSSYAGKKPVALIFGSYT